MVRNILCLCFGHVLVYQVFAANIQGLHPAVKQYLLSGLGSVPQQSRTLPAVTINKQSPPNYQSLAALASLLSATAPKAVPKLAQSSISSNLIPSNLLASLTQEPPSNSQVDATLLNNLAVALQLLLVSNLLNNPAQETTPEPPSSASGYSLYETADPAPVTPVSVSFAHSPNYQVSATPVPQTQQSYYSSAYEQPKAPSYGYEQPPTEYNPPAMPNANFMGGSTFPNSNPFGATIPSPMPTSSRGGFSLMSPYEALSPSSPYSDPILSSPFGSVMTSKRDFQSPYSAMMAADNKDLFSMSDFF